jgi:hypothetical protein
MRIRDFQWWHALARRHLAQLRDLIVNLAMLIFRAAAGFGVAPTITGTSGGGSYTTGNTITLGVTATGMAPLTYQWRKNGTPISGATSATYVISGASSSHGGTYTCVVSNPWGTVTSAGISVSVSDPAPEPPSVYVTGAGTFPVGTAVTVTAHVSGDGSITITWITGPTGPYPMGSVYTFSTPLVPGSFSVTCVVESEYGSASTGVTVNWV